MLFAGGAKGLALDRERLALKVVEADDPAVIVHDPKNRGIAAMLIEMPQGFPVALGVIYEDPAPTFESAVSNRTQPPLRARRPTSRRSSPRARPGRSKRNRTSFDPRSASLDNITHTLAGALHRPDGAEAPVALRHGRLPAWRQRARHRRLRAARLAGAGDQLPPRPVHGIFAWPILAAASSASCGWSTG